jgi:hypothetical protein
MTSRHWTRFEVEATVAAYVEMLMLELNSVAFNKAERWRALQPLLNDRPKGSIERKHQNISAILIEMGLPYVDGYKPLGNYQGLLRDVVAELVASRPDLLTAVRTRADDPPRVPEATDILACMIDPPEAPSRRPDRLVAERPNIRPIAPENYLLREARNSALGRAGEEFVMKFERARLLAAGRDNLAADMVHVSRARGDGAGYDIMSFESDGRERLIEVKTTRYGQYTPFFVTANEVGVSRDAGLSYHLYRLFSFEARPRLFSKAGSLDHSFALDPSEYVARLS